MKDIVITGKRIRQELVVFLMSFVLAFAINVTAVVIYDRPLIELVSQIGYVTVIAIFVYLLLAIIRIVVALLLKLFKIK